MNAAAAQPPAGPKACAAIARTAIAAFAARLEAAASGGDGFLSAEEIRQLASGFVAEASAGLQPAFQQSWDDCTRAREARQWESARRNPFNRILAKPFAHLFPPRQGDDGGKGVLSRRLLPGFHMAIDKMIGPMLFEQCQQKSLAILERHRKAGGGYDWDAIHADSDTVALSTDVLVVVAHYFGNFERRRDWFMAVVNSHLAPAAADAADAHWQLAEPAFAELMRALFADVAARMQAEPAAMRRRYGEQTCETVEGFFRHLEA